MRSPETLTTLDHFQILELAWRRELTEMFRLYSQSFFCCMFRGSWKRRGTLRHFGSQAAAVTAFPVMMRPEREETRERPCIFRKRIWPTPTKAAAKVWCTCPLLRLLLLLLLSCCVLLLLFSAFCTFSLLLVAWCLSRWKHQDTCTSQTNSTKWRKSMRRRQSASAACAASTHATLFQFGVKKYRLELLGMAGMGQELWVIDLSRTSHRFNFFPAFPVTSVSSGENSVCQVDDCERMIENLTEQNKKLLDEGLMLRSFLFGFGMLWISSQLLFVARRTSAVLFVNQRHREGNEFLLLCPGLKLRLDPVVFINICSAWCTHCTCGLMLNILGSLSFILTYGLEGKIWAKRNESWWKLRRQELPSSQALLILSSEISWSWRRPKGWKQCKLVYKHWCKHITREMRKHVWIILNICARWSGELGKSVGKWGG